MRSEIVIEIEYRLAFIPSTLARYAWTIYNEFPKEKVSILKRALQALDGVFLKDSHEILYSQILNKKQGPAETIFDYNCFISNKLQALEITDQKLKLQIY